MYIFVCIRYQVGIGNKIINILKVCADFYHYYYFYQHQHY